MRESANGVKRVDCGVWTIQLLQRNDAILSKVIRLRSMKYFTHFVSVNLYRNFLHLHSVWRRRREFEMTSNDVVACVPIVIRTLCVSVRVTSDKVEEIGRERERGKKR